MTSPRLLEQEHSFSYLSLYSTPLGPRGNWQQAWASDPAGSLGDQGENPGALPPSAPRTQTPPPTPGRWPWNGTVAPSSPESPWDPHAFSSLGPTQKEKFTRMLRKGWGPFPEGWTPISDWKLGTGTCAPAWGTAPGETAMAHRKGPDLFSQARRCWQGHRGPCPCLRAAS